jgi:hypothetical protein
MSAPGVRTITSERGVCGRVPDGDRASIRALNEPLSRGGGVEKRCDDEHTSLHQATVGTAVHRKSDVGSVPSVADLAALSARTSQQYLAYHAGRGARRRWRAVLDLVPGGERLGAQS